MTEPIQSYDPERPCPKCGQRGEVKRFSTSDREVRGGHGEMVDVCVFGSPPLPHLVIGCVGCGWQWLTETADAEVDQVTN